MGDESWTVQPVKATIIMGFESLVVEVVLMVVVCEISERFLREFDRVFLQHGVFFVVLVGADETGGNL
jgi:hypothetical protein